MEFLDFLFKRYPQRDFTIEWFAEGGGSHEVISEPRLFLSDVPGLRKQDVDPISIHCSQKNVTLVFITPGLDPSALSTLESGRAFAVRGTTLPGQPLEALLEDIGIVTGGRCFARALGYGLSEEEMLGLYMLPGGGELDLNWNGVTMQMLGRCRTLSLGERGITIGGGYGNTKDVRGRIRGLGLEMSLASADEELQGLQLRSERLGESGRKQTEHVLLNPGRISGLELETVPAGWTSSYFVTDPYTMEAVLKNARVLLLGGPLSRIEPIAPVLWQSQQQNFSLLVVAPEICGPALATMVVGKLMGNLQCLAVSLMSSGELTRANLSFIAQWTGATVLHPADETRLREPSLDYLGWSPLVVANKKWTLVRRGAAGQSPP